MVFFVSILSGALCSDCLRNENVEGELCVYVSFDRSLVQIVREC